MAYARNYRIYLVPRYTDPNGAHYWILCKRNTEENACLLGSTSPRKARYTSYDAWVLTGSWLNYSAVISEQSTIECGNDTTDVFYYEAPANVIHHAPNKDTLLLLPQEGYASGQKRYKVCTFEGIELELPIERAHAAYLRV